MLFIIARLVACFNAAVLRMGFPTTKHIYQFKPTAMNTVVAKFLFVKTFVLLDQEDVISSSFLFAVRIKKQPLPKGSGERSDVCPSGMVDGHNPKKSWLS
jgi:hypothetical protein